MGGTYRPLLFPRLTCRFYLSPFTIINICHIHSEGDILQINITICDDNKAHSHRLQELIMECPDSLNSYKITSFTSGKSMFNNFRNASDIPDVVFMDIELEDNILGTNIGRKIKDINPDVLLIYISAYDCYYKDLVKSEPFSFISKPINLDELKEVLSRAVKRLYYIKHEFIFEYNFNGVTSRVDLKEVIYFESKHRIINIHMCSGEIFYFYGKLDDVESEVEEMYRFFLRPNKSHYVNYNYVEHFSDRYITISGFDIKISRKYRDKFVDKKFLLL